MCEDILRLQICKNSAWLVVAKNVWRRSPTTSERGFWLNTEKDWRHSGATTMRGLWLVSGKKIKWWHCATTSERGFWIITEKDLRHSGATTMRGVWLVSGQKYVMTFCDYIWARFLNNYWKNNWRQCETTTERVYIYARFMIG